MTRHELMLAIAALAEQAAQANEAQLAACLFTVASAAAWQPNLDALCDVLSFTAEEMLKALQAPDN